MRVRSEVWTIVSVGLFFLAGCSHAPLAGNRKVASETPLWVCSLHDLSGGLSNSSDESKEKATLLVRQNCAIRNKAEPEFKICENSHGEPMPVYCKQTKELPQAKSACTLVTTNTTLQKSPAYLGFGMDEAQAKEEARWKCIQFEPTDDCDDEPLVKCVSN